MKIQDQVTSLELSERLEELGVKQKSYFRWNMYNKTITDDGMGVRCIPAYTTSELGEMLPGVVKGEGLVSRKCQVKRKYWICGYTNIYFQNGKTEVDARAKMLIYLLENNLTKTIQ